MTGVAITIIVNKTTTLIGITVETLSNVPTITPKGIIVITRILVVMTIPKPCWLVRYSQHYHR